MAVGYISASAAIAVGTTSCAPAYPATQVNAGDLILLVVINKYPNNAPTTPTGWILVSQTSSGAGSAGADSGTIYVSVYAKIADGTETGTLTVTITSGNSCIARMFSFSKELGASWDNPAAIVGAVSTPTTAIAVTPTTTMNIRLGDLIAVFSAFNSDAWAFSGEDIQLAGVIFGTGFERSDSGTAQGDDCRLVVSTHKVNSGDTVGVPLYSMTASGSDANSPAGPVCIVRLREIGADAARPKPRRSVIYKNRTSGAARMSRRPLDLQQMLEEGRRR